MVSLSLRTRLHRLEVEQAKIPPTPESNGDPIDFDASMRNLERRLERILTDDPDLDPDPMIRLRYWREECAKDEQAIAAEFVPSPGGTVNTAPNMARLSLPMNQYRLRAAELEILERAGYDTSELRAKHQRHAANPFKWPPPLDNPLPDDAKMILDRVARERRELPCLA